ncbi:MAG: HD domain-containing phosphohydrolase [Thermodesulfobacteriota bacterium]
MKIRTRIFMAFLSIILLFLAVGAVVATYNQRLLYRSIERTEAIREEIGAVSELTSLSETSLIPAKQYILTKDLRYKEEFNKLSAQIDGLIFKMAKAHYSSGREPDAEKVEAEERFLSTISLAWSKIRNISGRIFALQDTGKDGSGYLMAGEMEKKWGASMKKALSGWREIEMDELAANSRSLEEAWSGSWKVMAAAAVLLLTLGLYISCLLSRRLTASMKAIKSMVDDMTSGRDINPMNVKPGYDLEGLIIAFNAMKVTVDETRERLERSAERYRRLIHTAPDAVFLLDPVGERIVEANSAAALLTGYEEAELAGLSITNVHPKCCRSECGGILTLASKKSRGECQKATILKKDGTTVPVVITASRVEIEEGELALCFVRDITERVALEEVRKKYTVDLELKVRERTAELRNSIDELGASKNAVLELLETVKNSKREWEDTFDSIPDPIFIHDSDFKVVKCNMAYQRLAAMPFQEIFKRPYYEVYPILTGPFSICAKEKESYCRVEEEEIMLDEDITYRVRYIPFKDHSGRFTYSLHLMEDITEEKVNLARIEREVAVNRQLLKIAEATAKTTNLDSLIKEIVSCVKDILSADMVASYLGDNETKSFIPCHGAGIEGSLMSVFKSEPIDGKSHSIIKALERGEIHTLSTADNIEMNNVFNGNKFVRCLGDKTTIALIPITNKGTYLGLIMAAYTGSKDEIHVIGSRELQLMSGFASQASVAIDEARLYKESINKTMDLSRKIMTIRMLGEIDRSILSAPGADEILETSARMISKLVQCDGADVWVVKDNRIVYTAGHGLTLAQRGNSFNSKAPFFSRILRDSMPFTLTSAEEITTPSGIEKNFISQGLNSIIIIPLRVKDEIKGLLNVSSRRYSAFSSEDLSTLEKFSSHIGVALENTRLISDLEGLFLGTVRTLSKTIDAKSPWTRGHSERVTEIAMRIARVMGLKRDRLRDLELAGLLHDIGKIATYEGILDKAGRLTDTEYEQIKHHPVKGAEILSPLKQLKDIIPGVKFHHVWYDGRGYPETGIRGRDIHPFARILAVADTIDAMSADRPYRKGKSIDEVVAELKRCSGTQFDPEVVEAFLSTLR